MLCILFVEEYALICFVCSHLSFCLFTFVHSPSVTYLTIVQKYKKYTTFNYFLGVCLLIKPAWRSLSTNPCATSAACMVDPASDPKEGSRCSAGSNINPCPVAPSVSFGIAWAVGLPPASPGALGNGVCLVINPAISKSVNQWISMPCSERCVGRPCTFIGCHYWSHRTCMKCFIHITMRPCCRSGFRRQSGLCVQRRFLSSDVTLHFANCAM